MTFSWLTSDCGSHFPDTTFFFSYHPREYKSVFYEGIYPVYLQKLSSHTFTLEVIEIRQLPQTQIHTLEFCNLLLNLLFTSLTMKKSEVYFIHILHKGHMFTNNADATKACDASLEITMTNVMDVVKMHLSCDLLWSYKKDNDFKDRKLTFQN